MIHVETFDYGTDEEVKSDVDHGYAVIVTAGVQIKVMESDGNARIFIDPVNREFISRLDVGLLTAHGSQVQVIVKGEDIRTKKVVES